MLPKCKHHILVFIFSFSGGSQEEKHHRKTYHFRTKDNISKGSANMGICRNFIVRSIRCGIERGVDYCL